MGFHLTLRLGEAWALVTDESCRGVEARRIGARAAVKGFQLMPRLGGLAFSQDVASATNFSA